MRVPADHLLGKQVGVFAISQTRLGGGRVYHAARCVHIHGSLGVSNEMPFVGNLVASMVMGIADGPTEVHKVTVAKQHLREYRDVADPMFPDYSLINRRAAARAMYDPVEEIADAAEAVT